MREMEACWPSGVGPAGAGVKPPCAALAEDRRGERQGNGAARPRQVGIRKTIQRRPVRETGRAFAVEAPKAVEVASKPRISLVLGMSLAGARVPGQVVPGVEAA